MATAGLLTCILKLMASGLPENVSDHGAYRNKTLTAAGLSGLLTRFPLITTHKPCLRRQEVAANQLRLQRYNKK